MTFVIMINLLIDRLLYFINTVNMKNLKKLQKEELKTIVGGVDCTRLCFVNDKLTCVPYNSCCGPGLEP